MMMLKPHNLVNTKLSTNMIRFKQEVFLLFICINYAYSSFQQIVSASPNKHNSPSWKRPGCHRVGHTRTISIQGCVKFNLTTNACRGYCLSYSIPSIEDIGPPSSDTSLPEFASTNNGNGISIVPNTLKSPATTSFNRNDVTTNDKSGDSFTNSHREQSINLERLESILSTLSSTSTTTTNGNNNNYVNDKNRSLSANGINPSLENQSTLKRQQQQHDNQDNQSQTISLPNLNNIHRSSLNPDLITSTGPIEANQVHSGAKQDIISIGQCCSMIEAEFIMVNVRCENGIQGFKFKSAKSCECFFCKQM